MACGWHAALLFVDDVREKPMRVHLDDREYLRTLHEATGQNFVGGAIYDALLGRCALKAKAEILYTWNTKDFLRLPKEIATHVKRPDV